MGSFSCPPTFPRSGVFRIETAEATATPDKLGGPLQDFGV
ncbi:hypothetical protein Pd630_LPD04352 [Rhodococcus opacus PD630]|nr:hypothetical protein Pd630_LPD04352 [Rhodococcus opacus PD630]